MTPHHSHHHAPLCAAPHCRAAAVAAAPHLKAAFAPLVARAYRDGWADGYLARHHETEETR